MAWKAANLIIEMDCPPACKSVGFTGGINMKNLAHLTAASPHCGAFDNRSLSTQEFQLSINSMPFPVLQLGPIMEDLASC